MYSESGSFDPPQDPNPIPGPLVDTPSQAAAYYNSTDKNGLDETIKLSNFSIEDLSNYDNPSFEEAAAMGLDHLQHQLGFDLEQELHSHLMQGEPSMDNSNWNSSMQEIQEPTIHHQLQHDEVPQHEAMHQNIQFYSADPAVYTNGTYSAAPDLLNLLQLPRCNMPPVFPPPSSISFSNVLSELPVAPVENGGSVLYDSSLHLGYPHPQPHVLRDLYESLPQNYGLFCGVEEREAAAIGGGDVLQDMMDGRQFDEPVVDYRREMGGVGRGQVKGSFATEKQRRDQLSQKYTTLRSLVPIPTKTDRASIVGDAIEYIKELHRTIEELKILVESKKHGRERRKMLKIDDEAGAADMESSSMRPHGDDNGNAFNGGLRSSWLQRRTKESFVDVRLIEDEVNIKLSQKRKANCLLPVAKVLDELQLDLIHVAGGFIGNHYVFMFNTKISEGSSVYAGAMAKKLLEVMERQHPTSAFPGSF